MSPNTVKRMVEIDSLVCAGMTQRKACRDSSEIKAYQRWKKKGCPQQRQPVQPMPFMGDNVATIPSPIESESAPAPIIIDGSRLNFVKKRIREMGVEKEEKKLGGEEQARLQQSYLDLLDICYESRSDPAFAKLLLEILKLRDARFQEKSKHETFSPQDWQKMWAVVTGK